MFERLKQLKNLRDQAHQLKAQLANVTVSADASGGKIKVVMNGNHEIVSLDIDPSMFAPEHKDEVQQGLRQAMNDASKKVRMEMAKQFRQGGMNLPSFGG